MHESDFKKFIILTKFKRLRLRIITYHMTSFTSNHSHGLILIMTHFAMNSWLLCTPNEFASWIEQAQEDSIRSISIIKVKVLGHS